MKQDNIIIHEEPDYLIVLYLSKKGGVYEAYNGRGNLPFTTASKKDGHNYRHMRVNKLMELDREVPDSDRIRQIHSVEKTKKEYKNPKSNPNK